LAAVSQKDHLWITALSDPSHGQMVWSGQTRSPQFSAGQAWIAFTDHRQLIIKSRSGAESFLPFGSAPIEGRPRWSPAGDTLAVVKDADVYALRARDHWSPVKVFAGVETASLLGLLFSPDGKQLAVSLRVAGDDGNQAGSVRVVTLSDPKRVDLLLTLPDGIILDRWTPDGKNILFWKDPDFSASVAADGLPLYAASVPGGNVKSQGAQTLPHNEFSDFSPDGKLLALAEGNGRETWTQKRISVLNVSSGAKIFLTSEKEAALFPSWSPNGELIAYAAGPDEAKTTREGPNATLGPVHLWLMKSDGSQRRQLTSDPAYRDERPQWSSDGTTIVFCRVNTAGEGSLWRVNATGVKPEQIGGSFPLNYGMFGFYGYTDWSQFVALER
jgi:Tol biopolymer transport system component